MLSMSHYDMQILSMLVLSTLFSTNQPNHKHVRFTIAGELQYESAVFPCPHCKESLPARIWQGEREYDRRTEVETPSGWILIKTKG